MPFARRPFCQRVAAIVMMAAWVAFAVQGMFVAASEAATGDSSHYYLGFVFGHNEGEAHRHVVVHGHADGTVHQHAIDDNDDALDKHVKEPGSNMAVVVCVLPSRDLPAISAAVGRKLMVQAPDPLRVADFGGLRRPPRPPSIA